MHNLDSIQDTLTNVNIEWQANDYFIMPDIILPEYPKDKDIHLGFYALFICTEGNIELIINDVTIKVKLNCLYAFSPENIVKPKNKSHDCVLRLLYFTKDFLLKNNFKSNALDDFKFFSSGIHNKIILNQEEISWLLQLYDLLQVKKDASDSIYHVEIIRSLFYSFLYEAQSIYSKNTGTELGNKRESELSLKFNYLVKTQAITQHNLRFYANSLFITPKYLISAIKHATGKTPSILINEALVEEAKQYLVHTTLRIAEIADCLQFTDIATFSKFFKRYTTLSPTAFRKKFQA